MKPNRALRRKLEREKNKGQNTKVGVDVSEWDSERLARYAGVNVDALNTWCQCKATELAIDIASSMVDTLLESENYIAGVNVLVTLYALKKTFGGLKTVQKNMDKFLANMSKGVRYIEEQGARTAYDEICKGCGITPFELEDFDINKLLDSESKARMAAWRILKKVGESE